MCLWSCGQIYIWRARAAATRLSVHDCLRLCMSVHMKNESCGTYSERGW